MPVDIARIRVASHYATSGGQVREVVEIATRTVERMPPKSAKNLNRKKIKKRIKQVRYKSRGHKASMKYGPMIWVDIDKFARDVDKPVAAHYDPDYEA
jgi:hypothetical protein